VNEHRQGQLINALKASINDFKSVLGRRATNNRPQDRRKGKVNAMVEVKAMENQRQTIRSWRARLIGTLMLAAVMFLLLVGNAGAETNKTPQFISPLAGSTVVGTVKVLVFAPEYAQLNAEFGVDGGKWRPMSSPEPGVFTTFWNSAEAGRGKHTLSARFTYPGGDRPPVATISVLVWVGNASPDGQAEILPLPCIHVMGAYGLKPADCAAPATS